MSLMDQIFSDNPDFSGYRGVDDLFVDKDQSPDFSNLSPEDRLRRERFGHLETHGAVKDLEGWTEIKDPGYLGMLAASFEENVEGPVVGLLERGGFVNEGTRLERHKKYKETLENFLAASPSTGRLLWAGGTELGTSVAPLVPGGALGRAGATIASQAGLGSRAARIAASALPAGVEGAMVGVGNSAMMPENQRDGFIITNTLAAAGLGTLFAGATSLNHKTPTDKVLSDPATEAARRKVFKDEVSPQAPLSERIKGLAFRMYEEMSDEFAPALRIAKIAGQEGKVEAIVQRVRAAHALSESSVLRRTQLFDRHSGEYVKTGESLVDVLKTVDEPTARDAELYLARVRQVEDIAERAARGENITVSADAQKAARDDITMLQEKYGVTVKEVDGQNVTRVNVLDDFADRFRDWTDRAFLEPLKTVGVLDNAQYKAIKESNQRYAIFRDTKKLLSELIPNERLPQGKGSKGGAPISRLKGDPEGLIDPIFEASIKQAVRVGKFVERQNLRNLMADIGDDLAEAGIKEVVPAKKSSRVVAVEEGKKIFRAQESPKIESFPVWRKGKRQMYEAPPSLIRAIEGLDPVDLPLLMKPLKLANQLFRAGATMSAEFMARNPFRDQTTAAQWSEHGFIPFFDSGRVVVNELISRATGKGHTRMWSDFKNSGAGQSTFLTLDHAGQYSTSKEFRRMISSASGIRKSMQRWKENWLHPLHVVSDALEKVTRFAEFSLAREGGRLTIPGTRVPIPGTRGKGEKVPIAQAALDAAEVSLNFSKSGRYGKVWNSVEAFSNAAIRDVDKFAKGMKNKPLETMAQAMAFVTVPSLVNWAAWHNDKDYERLPEWDKMLFYHLRKNKDGSFIRMPRPVGIVSATFGYAVEQMLNYSSENQEDVKGNIAQAILQQTPLEYLTTATGPTPTGLEPVQELMTNWDSFRERPVFPAGLGPGDVLPEHRAYDSQGPTVRGLASVARKAGVKSASPIAVEHLIRGYGATLGASLFLDVPDAMIEGLVGDNTDAQERELYDRPLVKAFMSRPPVGFSSKVINDFYSLADSAREAKKSYDKYRKLGDSRASRVLESHPELLYSKALEAHRRRVSELRKTRKQILGNKAFNSATRSESLLELDQLVTQETGLLMHSVADLIRGVEKEEGLN